ncbi:GerAB/ArcD/ProY family transporter [Bacillus sp. FJAT-49736]|uniref:GerAB/ArcD/ProY family transporter n=1 Tax=Bacillus sp. FJAT-49736 TaxID=2833582 RepID=UPI001BCA48BD|nr:GerAB/ArcD/ProY family transporter [Bacillus sp. FJAT-49736]MBS4174741.1 GerAB/ArcD/ProY family transporter [Bacillus sp. FJAT-49736]
MQPPIIPENRKFSPYLVFFTVAAMQIGVGVLGFQRIIAKIAGYDSWQSVIIAGLSTHIIVWFLYKQLESVNGDITDIHRTVFGKWIGGLFNIIFIFYFSLLVVTVLRTYLEVVQVWMFPDMSAAWFSLLYLLLCIYVINGGIRTIVGLAFFGSILPYYIIYFYGFAIPFADFRHFLPIFNHSFQEVITATQGMTLTNLGYEVLLVYYPYIKQPNKSKKWAHIGLIFTTILNLYVTLITFAFYPQEQLQKNVWATLTTFKIIHFPVVERFEFIGIANWCLVVLPIICIALWSASRILKRTLKVKQKYGVVLLSFFIFIGCQQLKTRMNVDTINNLIANIGFILNYVYIPMLFVLLMVVNKVKKIAAKRK